MKKAKENKKAPAQKPTQTKAKQTKTSPKTRQENYMLVKSGLDREGNQLYTAYRVYERKPKGWKELKGATTAPKGYTWINNGKHILSSKRKYALVKA